MRGALYLFLIISVLIVSSCEVQEKVIVEETEQNVSTELLSYGNNYTGYLVSPKEEGIYPGIVMIHEWWGLNENIKDMAHDLAKEGYIVLAVDLYEGKVADNPEYARIYSTEARENSEKSILQMKSAVSFLKEYSNGKVASLGWCFGGGMSMQLSLNEDLDATVIYYGTLVTDKEKLKSLKSPVLGIFGEEDTSITVSTVHEFESALDNLGIENEIYIYDGLGHAFANPSNPGHDKKSTKDAWIKTVGFLNNHLK